MRLIRVVNTCWALWLFSWQTASANRCMGLCYIHVLQSTANWHFLACLAPSILSEWSYFAKSQTLTLTLTVSTGKWSVYMSP